MVERSGNAHPLQFNLILNAEVVDQEVALVFCLIHDQVVVGLLLVWVVDLSYDDCSDVQVLQSLQNVFLRLTLTDRIFCHFPT